MNTADVLGVALLVTGRPVAGAAVLAANLVYKLTAWPYVADRRFAAVKSRVSGVVFLAPPSRRSSLRIRKARSVMRAYESRQAAWRARWLDTDAYAAEPARAAVHIEDTARLYTEAEVEHIEPDCGV